MLITQPDSENLTDGILWLMVVVFLSRHSKEIIDFICSVKVEIPDVSSSGSKLITEQYDRYKDVFEDVQQSPVKILKLGNRSLTRDTTFMSADIAQSCSSMKNTFKMSMKYGSKSANIILRTSRDWPDDQMSLAVSNLMTISHMFGNLKDVIVNYCAACQLKTRPFSGDILDPSHVNTGATLASGHGEIDVWRQEEFVKVLNHESIHALRLDIKHIPEEQLLIFYRSVRIDSTGCGLGACKTKIYPNEAWTEMMADIFNVFYAAALSKKDPLELLQIERKWSLFQAAKVLELSGFETVDSFLRSQRGEERQSPLKVLRQKTNVFSYYILRAGMMYNINDYLKFVTNSSIFIRFTKNKMWSREDQPRLADFLNMSLHNLRDPGFKASIDGLIEIIRATKLSSFVNDTMRLTAISLST